MTRINLFRNTAVQSTFFRKSPAMQNSIAWGKINLGTTASPFVFAAILIVCSLAVGCSSEKPKTESSANQLTATPSTPLVATSTPTPAPITTMQAAAQPVHKKVVRKAPATVTYADKNSGVSFQYPRKYALKTGDAADELLLSDPVPMDFVQPGGGTIAAVSVPEGAYPKSDLASAFFDVSVNKTLTSEQCGEFSETKTIPATPVEGAGKPAASPSKMVINDMELQSTETLSTDGSRKEASKYYHAFENGTCYEFALKVATTGVETDEGGKHVDRDEIFKRLEKILATVKIKPVKDAEVTASVPAAQTPTAIPVTPAQ
jgi:hypothetical protein